MKNNDQNKELVQGFTLEELNEFDGKDGRPCYIAVDDKVYDLTASPLWQNGEHSGCEGISVCGKDLTKALEDDAPESHQAGHHRDFPIVGELV